MFVPGNEPVTRTVNRLYLADAVALEDSPEVGDRLGELLIGSLVLAPDRAEQITLGYASSPARHQRPKQACEAGRQPGTGACDQQHVIGREHPTSGTNLP